MQGMKVRLAGELNPTYHSETKPAHRNYWAHML